MASAVPGPGLGVRVIGEVTAEKVRILQEADAILRDEMDKCGYADKMSQFFAVLRCENRWRYG